MRALQAAMVAFTIAAIGTAGTMGAAQAEPEPGPVDPVGAAADQSFLTTLRAADISFNSPDQAAKAGRAVCDLADSGKPDDEIISILTKHNDLLSKSRANIFMQLSYHSYCPQYLVPGN